jgi:hypothetical protein
MEIRDSIQVISKMAKKRASDSVDSPMDRYIQAIGKTVRWKAKVKWNMSLSNTHVKARGI